MRISFFCFLSLMMLTPLPAQTQTQTPTASPTSTGTPVGTHTLTPTPTQTPNSSLTTTPTPDTTPTVTHTPTSTITSTPTITLTPTITHTPTHTPTSTPRSYIKLDFDADGITDLGGTYNQRDGSPNELVFHIDTSREGYIREEFGSAEDLYAPGEYTGDALWDIGVIESIGTQFIWRFLDTANGKKSSVTFGQTDDILVTGCDFNGDFTSELAVIRKNTLLTYDVLTGNQESITLDLTPEAFITDAYCATLDSDHVYELITLSTESEGEELKSTGPKLRDCSKLKTRRKKKRCKKRNRKKKRKYKKQKKLKGNEEVNSENSIAYMSIFSSSGSLLFKQKAIGGTKVFAFDVDKDGTLDPSVIREITSSKYALDSYTELDGSRLPVITSLPEVSGLIELSDGTLGYQNSKGRVRAYNPVTGVTSSLSHPGGDALLQSTYIHFTGKTNPEDPKGTCDEVKPAKDGANGFLWKNSEHGGLVVLFPASYGAQWSKVEVVKGGKVEASLYYTGKANGNRQHWRSTRKPGSFSNKAFVAATRGGKTICWQIENSGSRND